MKKYFVLYHNPPRQSFPQDMTTEERNIMLQHISYWNDLMSKGSVLAFGPVIDPNGIYGLGIVEAESQEQVNDFIANDPANGLNKYEVYAMMAVTPKK
jgi:uncharacterized protein YciI